MKSLIASTVHSRPDLDPTAERIQRHMLSDSEIGAQPSVSSGAYRSGAGKRMQGKVMLDPRCMARGVKGHTNGAERSGAKRNAL